MSYLVFGATGLVGSSLIEILPNVTCVVRKLNSTAFKEIELNKLKESSEKFDGVFCCLGTTIKKAKTKEAFKKVDLDLVIEAYEHAKKAQAKFFCVISSLGADKDSKLFYGQVKSQMENALNPDGIQIIIVRPSLLVGKRSEFRFSESLGIKLFGNIKSVFPKKYKYLAPIQARAVAQAMKEIAIDGKTNIEIEYQIKNPLN